jgi:hypothetical protein
LGQHVDSREGFPGQASRRQLHVVSSLTRSTPDKRRYPKCVPLLQISGYAVIGSLKKKALRSRRGCSLADVKMKRYRKQYQGNKQGKQCWLTDDSATNWFLH